MWKYPDLMGMYFMSTVGGVLPKIANGADLMLPGVVADVENLGMKAYCDGKLKKGDLLYINLVENKAAFAIGASSQASEDLYMQGMRGKAVSILHFAGDQLWASGSKTKVPDMGRAEGLQFLENLEKDSDGDSAAIEANNSGQPEHQAVDSGSLSDIPSIEKAVESLLLSPPTRATPDNEDHGSNDQEIGVTGKHPEQTGLTTECVSEVCNQHMESENKPTLCDGNQQSQHPDDSQFIDDVDENNRTPEEIMDDIIETAFLQALRTTAKKAELPLLTSTFFRQHMVPASPNELQMELKKSSYKKLGKFLSKMNEEKIIVLNEQKKGVEVISEIHYEHEKLANFRPVKMETAASGNIDDAHDKYVPPVITELYLVTADVANFFRKCGLKKGDGVTAAEVRTHIREYVNKEELQHPTDPSIINLDPVIADVVLVKGENLVLTFRWDKLTSRVTSKMSKGYCMDFKSGKQVVQKGKLEPIDMMLGTRSGNKKVTLIHNLDLYDIDMAEFAHKCQVGVAASTAVHEAPNKKRAGGHPVMEVLIQGNQIAFASKLLVEEYCLPRKYIRGMELAAKSKKGGGGGSRK